MSVENDIDSLDYMLEGPARQRSLSLFMRWRFERAMNADGEENHESQLVRRLREREPGHLTHSPRAALKPHDFSGF